MAFKTRNRLFRARVCERVGEYAASYNLLGLKKINENSEGFVRRRKMSTKENKTLAKNGPTAHDSSALERARRDKWNEAAKRARLTDKLTETLFRALSNRVARCAFPGSDQGNILI
jgi:hypothetical protein